MLPTFPLQPLPEAGHGDVPNESFDAERPSHASPCVAASRELESTRPSCCIETSAASEHLAAQKMDSFAIADGDRTSDDGIASTVDSAAREATSRTIDRDWW